MTKPTYRVMLFDLDGTVLDTNHLIVTSFQHTFRERLQLNVMPETLYPHFGEPLPLTMEHFAPGRAEELLQFYREFNHSKHDQLIRNFPGMPEAIAQLRGAGIKLGIVTSKRTELARRGLRVCELESYFDTVVGLDDTPKHKPEAEPALAALERLGEEPGRDVLMVGDSRFDILCGRNAGLSTVAVGWTVMDRQALDREAGPDYWVERPADLVTLVR